MVLVALSVAAFVAVGNERQARRDLLLVARDVPAGQVLTAQDLRAVSVGAAGGVDVVAADGVAAVLGRVAVVPLLAGSLLPAGAVGDGSRVPPEGQALVGASLRAGQFPPGLARGDRVSILLTAVSAQAGTVSGSVSTPSTPSTESGARSVEGLVVGVGAGLADPTGDGGVVVSLQVAGGDAAPVAEAAAAGRVVLVVRAVSR
ncbi:hypothetical protein IHE48_27980 [Frankia sp. CH37]|nr:hypothetical protein [Parafrankia sp. CH37]